MAANEANFPLAQRPDETDADNRRNAGRLPLENVTSSIGPVLDISAGGMRARCRQVPDRLLTVTISDGTSEVIIDARVVWARKCGFRKHEVGLKFLDVNDEKRKQLVRMSIQNRERRTM